MGILLDTKPREEVLKGDLEDAIFAADFGDLIAGRAPKVYSNAATFFQNTRLPEGSSAQPQSKEARQEFETAQYCLARENAG
jgi:hypothetical protein